MKALAWAILRALDRRAAAGDLTRLPAWYRRTGGGLTGGLATARILRFALRWPGLTGFALVALLAARIVSRRRRRDDVAPAR
jgi:hypothetical protein